MPTESININLSITWLSPNNAHNQPYKWGDKKDKRIDPDWGKKFVIYRWVQNSTGLPAQIGETDRELTARINNYISASPGSMAGETNRRVCEEQRQLFINSDYLYLEYTDSVPGYNLANAKDRKYAEKLLIGFYRPYLQ